MRGCRRSTSLIVGKVRAAILIILGYWVGGSAKHINAVCPTGQPESGEES
jgi:hypothetical protein